MEYYVGGEQPRFLSCPISSYLRCKQVEKQFYLDQAKLLKESFNSRYPDYVYRRRPNNSRKRRRGDAGTSRPTDHGDGDDIVGMGDLGESSPTDGEDSQADSASETHLSRMSHDTSQSYREHESLHSRTSPFAYHSSDLTYRHAGSHENRLPYMSSTPDRIPHNLTSSAPPNSSPRIPQQSQFPYQTLENQHSHSQSPMYNNSVQSNQDSWESRVRSTTSNWLGSGTHDRPSVSTTLTGLKSHSYPSASPASSWHTSGSSAVPSASTDSSSSTYAFSTLSSPFYPNQPSHLGGNYSPGTPSNGSYPSSANQPSQIGGRSYDQRNYASSPSISPAHFPTTSSRDTPLYPSLNQRGSLHGHSGLPRALPLPVQPPMPGYSQSSPSQLPSNNLPVPQISNYWSRDKMEGL